MRYIEIVAEFVAWRHELAKRELCSIGDFTRENIARWLDSRGAPFEIGVYGWKDFHAVCDDVEIPWATEAGREEYRRITELSAAKLKR